MSDPKQRRFTDFLWLPPEVTPYEQSHVTHLNKVAVWSFLAHVPVFMGVAWWHETGVLTALLLTTLTALGPVFAMRTLPARQTAMVVGFTAMCMGGLLVHFGQGPVQIEMHFYFFVLLALLSTYGNPAVVLTAAVTVTVHHLAVWWLLPSSVFNYDASFWVVAVHAVFVVLESTASCYLARNFFDDVIGLEKVVQARTAALDERNAKLRLVMDNVSQGFLTVSVDGRMSEERSAAVATILGSEAESASWTEYLATVSPGFAETMAMHWEELVDSFMPLELLLDQLPSQLSADGKHIRFDYTPIFAGDDELAHIMVVISDVTARVEREHAEQRQRELMGVFGRVMRDRAGFVEFYEEADAVVQRLTTAVDNPAVMRRDVHTLKGICAIFDVRSVAEACHAVETLWAEEARDPSAADATRLQGVWSTLKADLDRLLGEVDSGMVEVAKADVDALVEVAQSGASGEELVHHIRRWACDPLSRRFERVGAQARRIGEKVGKRVRVSVEDGDLRLDGEHWGEFWSAFVHVVRNAVDHGIEAPEVREQNGKPSRGQLTLRARLVGDRFQIEVEDDGAGIDWARIRSKAEALGLPHDSHDDLVDALFADGLSSRDQASELSGRGVGMGALRAATEGFGGQIQIDSTPGQGTRVCFDFPAEAMLAGGARAAA